MSVSFVEKDEPFDLYRVWVVGHDRPFMLELPIGEVPDEDDIIRVEFLGAEAPTAI